MNSSTTLECRNIAVNTFICDLSARDAEGSWRKIFLHNLFYGSSCQIIFFCSVWIKFLVLGHLISNYYFTSLWSSWVGTSRFGLRGSSGALGQHGSVRSDRDLFRLGLLTDYFGSVCRGTFWFGKASPKMLLDLFIVKTKFLSQHRRFHLKTAKVRKNKIFMGFGNSHLSVSRFKWSEKPGYHLRVYLEIIFARLFSLSIQCLKWNYKRR